MRDQLNQKPEEQGADAFRHRKELSLKRNGLRSGAVPRSPLAFSLAWRL